MSKRKINYICQNCNHIELEPRTWKLWIKKMFKYFIIAVILFLAILGSFGAYNLISYGIYEDTSLLFHPSGGVASLMNLLREGHLTSEQMQNYSDYVAPIIEGCEDQECQAKKIFRHLERFTYREGTSWNIENILKEQAGDCDQMSITFISLLKSININSGIKCTVNHCWVVVKLPNKKIRADISQNKWREI